MDNSCNLRTLAIDDLDSLLDLYAQLHEADLPRPERSQIERVWLEALANKNIRYFGYFIDDRLVSSCTVAVIPNLTRACQSYAIVENVITLAAFRRRGFGKAVLQAALDFAWSMDCYKVMLMTGRFNESTYSFYESAGFKGGQKQAFIAWRPQG